MMISMGSCWCHDCRREIVGAGVYNSRGNRTEELGWEEQEY